MENNPQVVANESASQSELPEYEAPAVRVMTETEVLKSFQVTAAGTGTWWAM
jgi:hypothetical protein